MLLSYFELLGLIENGVIQNVKPEAVNASSIDIHLGNKILIEQDTNMSIVDYSKRQRPNMVEVELDKSGHLLAPSEFILAHSVEVFNLPNNVSAEYKLKSSMARIGLEHLNAGWCDAGWHGSVLTLELKNMLNHHAIRICPGDAIGQIVFFRHAPVPDKASYATRGRYNNNQSVETIKE